MGFGIGDVAKASEHKILQLDVVAHNLANVGTTGFKAERYHPGAVMDVTPKAGSATGAAFTIVDHSQGSMQKTDNALDVAIEGEGFFAVQTAQGMAFTRNGNFLVNKNNQLVTQSGQRVLGKQGPITISGGNVDIGTAGDVSVNGVIAGELRIVRFDNVRALTRNQEGLFSDPGTAGMKALEKPEIKSRQLEMSNVNAIREMAEMIDIQRSFETYQKVIHTMTDLDKLATSRIGKLA
jgi:flagellar basal-body rod protein FlgG